MKKLFIFLLFIPLLTLSQIDSTKVFSLNTTVKVGVAKTSIGQDGSVGVLQIKVINNDVYMTNTGQYYIKYTDGNLERRRYIGWTTDYKYEGMPVFIRNNRFYYLQIDKDGLPYGVELPKWLFKE